MSEEIMEQTPVTPDPEQPEFAEPVEGEYNPIEQGDPHWLDKLDANGRYLLSRIGGGEKELDDLRDSVAQRMLQYDAACTFEDGVFSLSDPPDGMGERLGVWFAAPEKFTRNNLIRVKEQYLTVYGPNCKLAPSGCFAANALVFIGLDLQNGSAFLAGGGGSGVPAVSQTSISVVAGDAEATVTLSNQGVGGFAGTLLVVKQGSGTPESETDGVVHDAGAASSLVLANLENGTPYVVRAFAYNGDREYQITTAGAIESFTPTDIPEDPPGNVAGFKGTPGQTGSIVLSWTDPSDSELIKWAGTMIRRKTGDYPADETDGELVTDSDAHNQYQTTGYTDSGLDTATTYYYQAFPYSTANVFNRNEANRVSLIPIPSSFKFQTVVTSSGNWAAPADGWYRVFVIGKSGDGGAGGGGNGGDYRAGPSGGGGGGSGAVAASLLYYAKGTSIPITITTGYTQFGSTTDAESLTALAGSNGQAGAYAPGTPRPAATGGAGGAGAAIPAKGNLFRVAGYKGGAGGNGGYWNDPLPGNVEYRSVLPKAGSAGGNSGAKGGIVTGRAVAGTGGGGSGSGAGGVGARYGVGDAYPYLDKLMSESQKGGNGNSDGSSDPQPGTSVLAIVNSPSLVYQGGGSGGAGYTFGAGRAGGKGNTGMVIIEIESGATV